LKQTSLLKIRRTILFGQFHRFIVSSVMSARFTRVAIRPRGRKCLTGGSCLSYAFINGNYPAINSYNRFIRVGHPITVTRAVNSWKLYLRMTRSKNRVQWSPLLTSAASRRGINLISRTLISHGFYVNHRNT